MVPSFNATGTSFGAQKGGHSMVVVVIRLRMCRVLFKHEYIGIGTGLGA